WPGRSPSTAPPPPSPCAPSRPSRRRRKPPSVATTGPRPAGSLDPPTGAEAACAFKGSSPRFALVLPEVPTAPSHIALQSETRSGGDGRQAWRLQKYWYSSPRSGWPSSTVLSATGWAENRSSKRTPLLVVDGVGVALKGSSWPAPAATPRCTIT